MLATVAQGGDWLGMALMQPIPLTFIRLLLCCAFLWSGITKAFAFRAATAETARLGIPAPAAFAFLTIVVQLGGSALVVSGLLLWVGALALAGFTLVVSVLAHDFWNRRAGERAPVIEVFLEHLGLVGSFLLLVAVATPPMGVRASIPLG